MREKKKEKEMRNKKAVNDGELLFIFKKYSEFANKY